MCSLSIRFSFSLSIYIHFLKNMCSLYISIISHEYMFSLSVRFRFSLQKLNGIDPQLARSADSSDQVNHPQISYRQGLQTESDVYCYTSIPGVSISAAVCRPNGKMSGCRLMAQHAREQLNFSLN